MNKKGMELPINMVVVIILGLTMLGIGFSIFFSAYNQTVDVKERVDSQTEQQLNDLLDTGEAIVIPINTKEAERGDFLDFDLGISNELGEPRQFFVFVRYDSATRTDLSLDPRSNIIQRSCRAQNGREPADCGDLWVLIPRFNEFPDQGYENDRFALNANERATIPIRIILPRRIDISNQEQGLPKGQYVFDVDIYQDIDLDNTRCEPAIDTCRPYFSKKKIYITVK